MQEARKEKKNDNVLAMNVVLSVFTDEKWMMVWVSVVSQDRNVVVRCETLKGREEEKREREKEHDERGKH